jgi:hypothetical protein
MLKRLSPKRTVYNQQRGRPGHGSSSAYLPLLGFREAEGDGLGGTTGEAEDGARIGCLVAAASGVGFALTPATWPEPAGGLLLSIVNAPQKTTARRPSPTSTATGWRNPGEVLGEGSVTMTSWAANGDEA